MRRLRRLQLRRWRRRRRYHPPLLQRCVRVQGWWRNCLHRRYVQWCRLCLCCTQSRCTSVQVLAHLQAQVSTRANPDCGPTGVCRPTPPPPPAGADPRTLTLRAVAAPHSGINACLGAIVKLTLLLQAHRATMSPTHPLELPPPSSSQEAALIRA